MMQVVGNLSTIVERSNIRSSIGSFRVFPEYTTTYPKSVVETLFEIYKEYNRAFIPLVVKNREWEADYRFCFAEDELVNYLVQVDMAGLTNRFLRDVDTMSESDVTNVVRRSIFEIKNSLAIYQLLE